jgi:hypothetical protein
LRSGVFGRGIVLAIDLRRFFRAGTCKPASLHSLAQRSLPICKPSRPKNMRIRRDPNLGYCPDSRFMAAITGMSRVGILQS